MSTNKNDEIIRLAHGGGGRSYHRLIRDIFLPAFDNAYLRELTDSAIMSISAGHMAFTTDSYVVKPRFFLGGDIGRLAVCGTVNDLAMSGAEPKYLTCGMIIEAGFPLSELEAICASMAKAAREAGVFIVSGDTKVVSRGECDGIYINTAGVGLFRADENPPPQRVYPGDVILLSGAAGNHGLSVLAAREELGFNPPIQSDAAPLNAAVRALLDAVPQIHALRDPTRGGVAGVANDWAAGCGHDIVLHESALPIDAAVRAGCALLGLDALYLANEGKFMAAFPPQYAEAALAALHKHELTRDAAIIGEARHDAGGRAVLRTVFATERLLDTLEGEQIPRIC